MGTTLGGSKSCVLVLSLLVLSILVSNPGIRKVQAATTASVVYVDPVSIGGPSLQSAGSTFTVNVRLNLTAGEINTFDVRLNYSNVFNVVKADSISSSGNIFSPYSTLPIWSCIDVVAGSAGHCESGATPDTTGQVHFSQSVLGQTVTGPVIGGLLFSIQFRVVGNGTSVFVLDRANLVDPVGSDSSNPNPHFVTALRQGGIFANRGLVAFYNSEPTDSAAFLPGHSILFDASGSFDANHTTPIVIASYGWTFGDALSTVVRTPTTTHVFLQPGSYSVSLTVNTTGSPTTTSSPFVENVVVVPALGSVVVALRDTSSLGLTNAVLVGIFNSSSSTSFARRTTSDTATFGGLSPGQYVLKFSGPSIHDYSKVENVEAGLATQDTVYLSLIPAPPEYGPIIFLGSLAVGVGLFSVLIILRAKRSRLRRKREA